MGIAAKKHLLPIEKVLGQVYRPDSVSDKSPAIIHLGLSLLINSCHLPAYSDGPPFAVYTVRMPI